MTTPTRSAPGQPAQRPGGNRCTRSAPGRAGSAEGSCTRRAGSRVENAFGPRGAGPGREHLLSPRVPGLPGARTGRVCEDRRRAGEGPVHQQWGGEPGALTQVTSGLCRKSSMSSETVRSMLRLRPPASAPRSPSAAPRHKAALLWQRAAGAGLRRLAPGRQRRGASPRSAASAAPRPARGWVRGGPAARGGTMRAAAPPPTGSPRLPARRLVVPGPGDAARAGLRRVPGGSGAVRTCVRRGGVRALGPRCPHRGWPPRAYGERGLCALGAPARGTSLHACVYREGPAPSAERSARVLASACAFGCECGLGHPALRGHFRPAARGGLSRARPRDCGSGTGAARRQSRSPGCCREAPPAPVAGEPSPRISRVGVGLAGRWSSGPEVKGVNFG